MVEIGIIAAFVAGLVSFASPCVLPLIPGFLAYLAGTQPSNANTSRVHVFVHSVFFVLGFGLIFALLGVLLNTVLSSVAYDVQQWLSRIGGLIIIFFGVYLLGLIKIPFLQQEHKVHVKFHPSLKYVNSSLFGAAFAVGWSPCVGAVLGSVLALAATSPGMSFWLLIAYSLGLGLPFLVVGAFTKEATTWIKKSSFILKYFNVVVGVLLIVLGILIFTQTLSLIANFDLVSKLVGP